MFDEKPQLTLPCDVAAGIVYMWKMTPGLSLGSPNGSSFLHLFLRLGEGLPEQFQGIVLG